MAPELSFTRAIFLSPELGFLGRTEPTFRQTPFREGQCLPARAGETAWRARLPLRQPRRTWLRVAFCAHVTEKARIVVNGCRTIALWRKRCFGTDAERLAMIDRPYEGEKSWRAMDPTMMGVLATDMAVNSSSRSSRNCYSSLSPKTRNSAQENFMIT